MVRAVKRGYGQTRFRSAGTFSDSPVAIHPPGSNKGHDTVNLQYSCGPVGCHLRRKVVEFAVSHETHKAKFGRLRSIPTANLRF
jgi:hypothetical protein